MKHGVWGVGGMPRAFGERDGAGGEESVQITASEGTMATVKSISTQHTGGENRPGFEGLREQGRQ